MALCKQCGKRSIWIDNNGLCEKCHDAAYVRMMKKRAGDTSAEAGVKLVRKGLVNHYVCRLCGETIPFSEAKTIDKRTGYCASCTRRLEKMSAKTEEPKEPAQTPKTDQHNFRLAGTTYREAAIKSLAKDGGGYTMTKSEIIEAGMDGERIYRYMWPTLQAELVPEPENPYDPNAIKVEVVGKHIGYIKRGQTKIVKRLIDSGRIEFINVYIDGGPYKIVTGDEDDGYELEKDTAPYWADIHVVMRK